MKTIDLSHNISSQMPVFPGDISPEIFINATIPENGYYERAIKLSSHSGTHIDAPAHIILHAPTLDRMPIDTFIGNGAMIDLSHIKYKEIEIIDLEPHEYLFKNKEFILINTGWSRYWGEEKYFREYPVLSIEAALWIDSFMLKGIGVDTVSVDALKSTDLPIHKVLLERSLIIENLTNLERLPNTGFTFICLPLKVEEADASPVRAAAIF